MFDFTTYMKNVAIKMKAISHQEESEKQKRFYRISGLSGIEELLSNLTDKDMYPAILVNDLGYGRIADNGNAVNYLDRQTHIFYIVNYCDLNDFDAKEQSLATLKSIMYKIIGKMRKDYREDNKGTVPKTGMRNLDQGSFFYQVISGFGPHCHGLMISFEMTPPVESDMKYNSNDWNE